MLSFNMPFVLVCPYLPPPPSDDPSAVVLMSPVHRSNPNIASSPTTVVAMLNSSREEVRTKDDRDRDRHSITEGTSLPRRDRTAAGICLQRGRSLHGEESQSQEEEEGHHHTRRYAMRSGTRPPRRHSSPTTTAVSRAVAPTLSPVPPSPELYDTVRSQLYEENRYALMDVVDRMPPPLLDAILEGALPDSFYENLVARVDELRRGHLASGDGDASHGAIHWFEGTFSSD